MANQNDTKTLEDLDLSGIEGYDDSSVDDSDVDDSAVDDSAIDDSTADDSDSDDEPISWSYIESFVPEPLHEDLKPLVEDWRRQYERVIDETAPFRRFAEQGYTDADIDMALQVQQALVKDPRRFYDGLGETYGWGRDNQLAAQLAAQQQQLMQAMQQPQQQQDNSMFIDEWGNETQQTPQAQQADPQLIAQLQETQQRLAQMEQFQQQTYAQQQQERQMQMGRSQLDNELNQLEAKYGQFDRKEVIKRAIANATAGNNPSVAQAYHELRDYEEGLRRRYASSRPPKVVGSGNGMAPAEKVDLSSDDAKREAALALALRLGANS